MLNILFVFFITAAIADLFIWGMAIGSGHHIPSATIRDFIVTFLVLVILSFGIFLVEKRFMKEKE
ncbi:hypothetical protein [Ferruginibacter sp.]|uniref:hypothetical protein n=1 Tax=Ferruginibacter sp. TaxID=1940288 RepID=UPI0026587E0C|nr:hypothetical protein [Ferruginibacter sp.]